MPPSPSPSSGPSRNRRRKFLILAALVALALILRSPLTAVAPIVHDLQTGLGIGTVMTALLTSIPVLCFGLLTPLASQLIARIGVEAAIFTTLGGAVAGIAVRSSAGIGPVLAGTVILGGALTVGNIVCLMVIARDFRKRARMVTGIYTSALNVGTMLTSALTAPLAAHAGWRIALASSALFAIPAAMLWAGTLRRAGRRETTDIGTIRDARAVPMPASEAAKPTSPWRRPLAWLLLVAFAAHLFIYYSLTAWLPAYLMGAIGMTATTAGVIASIFQILALLGSFGTPALAAVIPIPRLLVGMGFCWFVTPLGLLVAPQAWMAWSVIGGIATGGGFAVIFMLIMQYARDLEDNRRTSAMVQGGGYTLSSGGPLIVGGLHQALGGWTLGFLLLAAIAAIMLLCGLAAERTLKAAGQQIKSNGSNPASGDVSRL